MQPPDSAMLRDARAEFFRTSGLGADGGYSASRVHFRMGRLTITIPNTTSRRRALPLHDLHHLATGYDTSWAGEAEIAAWELAAGCGRHGAAWVLNLSAFAAGLIVAPGRTWRAFRRGRGSRTLYAEEWRDDWLDGSVGELRGRLQLRNPQPARTWVAALLFILCALPVGIAVAAFAAGAAAVVRLLQGTP